MKKLFFFPFFFLISYSAYAQQRKTKILLIGTFHFNNPGLDVHNEPDFDALNLSVQKELELISKKIAVFKPTKFFVEYETYKQQKLDSLYNLYLENKYFDFIKKNYPTKKYYSQGEIFQLAFRAGKASNLKTLNGIDCIGNHFPYDSMKNEMKKANQDDLLKSMETFPVNSTSKSLITRLINLNTSKSRKENSSWYIKYANRAGETNNFVGAYLASEWYKRNLYMYSLVQKLTTPLDEKVVLLLGWGHISIIEEFIKNDDRFEIVELIDILE